MKRLWWVGLPLAAVSAYFALVAIRKPVPSRPVAPPVPVIKSCGPGSPDMRRIQSKVLSSPNAVQTVQFDVPTAQFRIQEGATDMPPFIHGFDLTVKGSSSHLEISSPHSVTKTPVAAPDPRRTFSTYEERRILNSSGEVVGRDVWGYLQTGERWREVQIHPLVVAQYGLVREQDARLFDQVINSACSAAE